MKKTLFDVNATDSHERYIHLRDNPRFSERKQICDQMWKAYEPYAEPMFKDEFARQPQRRFWEMYLGCQILKGGYKLLPKSKVLGPDLCFFIGKRRVWLEATAVDEGTGSDSVPKVSQHFGSNPIPDDNIVLRFTNAISEKYKKLIEYQNNGIVAPSDAYVIGVNAAQIDMSIFDFDFPIPLILKAVFPLGEHIVEIDTQKEEIVNEGYIIRYSIAKKSGAPVPTTFFVDPNFSNISGIIYSLASFWDTQSQSSTNLVYVHNSIALASLPVAWLNAGKDCWKENDQIAIQENSLFA